MHLDPGPAQTTKNKADMNVNMKTFLIFFAAGSLYLGSCGSGSSDASKQAPATATSQPAGVVKGTVKEVLQTTSYTYLLLQQEGADQWVAVPSMQAKPGDTYYYKGGVKMDKFQSKELNRTFETVLFLEKVSADAASADAPAHPAATQDAGMQTPATADQQQQPTMQDNSTQGATGQGQYTRTPPDIEKKNVKIAKAGGGITIRELYAGKKSFAGKTVKISGEVTKFTPAVMNKNWIHIQDGTDDNGKFDLVVTSDKEVKVGDKITVEGKVSLDKDLGYGYFFDVIVEDANIK